MPHHYVNSHYFGNVSPSYQAASGHQHPAPYTVTPSAAGAIMMPPSNTIDSRPLSILDNTSSLVLAMSERALPVRKQSVFVAPTGLSSLRPPSSRPLTTVSYVLTPPAPSHSHQVSSLYSLSSAPLQNRFETENWNPLVHPFDLSENPSPSIPHNSSSSSLESRLSSTSNEDISQHISRIILKNKALIESFEPFSHSRHQSSTSTPSYSKRSISTTQLPSSHGQPQSQSVITSSIRSSLTSPYSLGTNHTSSSFDPQSASIRRYSSDLNANVTAYSMLQSALMGEAKSGIEMANGLCSVRVHPVRKFSELPYQLQPCPESFKYPFQGPTYLQPGKSANKQQYKNSIFLNAHELMEVFPTLNESSRSSSEPSLVRNLLTSKTSPFAHIASPELVGNLSSSSTNSNTNSDGSIIKDLLLKSRATSTHEISASLNSRSPPRKKSRTENSVDGSFSCHGRQSSSNLVFNCPLCNVGFRNRLNLEVHQKHYCRGNSSTLGEMSSMAKQNNIDILPITRKRSHQELEHHSISISERKVSVLERPSIISYSNSSPLSSSLSTLSLTSNSSNNDLQSQQLSPQHTHQTNFFGNILKSKLLSSGSESVSINSTPLKKRKISEPAFRYNYGTFYSLLVS